MRNPNINVSTLSTEQALNELKLFGKNAAEKKTHFIGYPINGDIELESFFKWWASSPASHAPLNDVGNPYQDLPAMLNARSYERQVLEIFSNLLNFPKDSSWGYITSGGTLSNEQGLLMGREILKKEGSPLLYFSEDCHYSIISVARLLGIDYRVIASYSNGEIDENDFERQLDTSRPALLSLNIGTTFKGAIDSIEKIKSVLKNKQVTHYYIHIDAALFGGYLPFLDGSASQILDVQEQLFDSIAISGHKFFGSPIPMGIFLTHKRHFDALQKDFIEYIQTKNATIPCSRSSLNTLLFWWILKTKESLKWKQEAEKMIEKAESLRQQLIDQGIKAWRNEHSNIVYFEAPKENTCAKWSLAQLHCKTLGHLAHVVVMQHVTEDQLNEFLNDIHMEIASPAVA